jgi:hypothetical protein
MMNIYSQYEALFKHINESDMSPKAGICSFQNPNL